MIIVWSWVSDFPNIPAWTVGTHVARVGDKIVGTIRPDIGGWRPRIFRDGRGELQPFECKTLDDAKAYVETVTH